VIGVGGRVGSAVGSEVGVRVAIVLAGVEVEDVPLGAADVQAARRSTSVAWRSAGLRI
jgi:hypothetical protein